ncbi:MULTISPECIES: DUF2158 domain-containing protein [unclassified Pseudomonas]|uniref:YodC family protein n=1 Tax=unclassified Pseudomonas TaxID=196821 RepID=UPI00128C4B2C|nr:MULTISPECIES: DUF2158 domain-containing protein [unclassified Pseudomonas]MPQ69536.1 DUF2158 domain-containing protein [Pseudomonas sp. MWU12-2323]
MSTDIEFMIGDIVKLKSGGPNMTVKAYRASADIYTCQWFAGKKLEQGEFRPHGLTIVVLEPEEN